MQIDSNPVPNPENNTATPARRIIHRVIGVTSAKGGAGRSFISGVLALELADRGYRVGILDANFSGSSIPLLFGLNGPVGMGSYSFLPLQSERGIKMLSADLLVDEDKNTIIWKEALSGKVIEELFREVEWGILDYLLIDMPPAASEITVSILQTIPVDAVLVVNTPWEISTRLNARGIRILREMGVPILGVVENMANRQETANSDALSSRFGLPVLARIPYIPENCILADEGKIEEISLPEGGVLRDAFESALLELEENALETAPAEEPVLQTVEPEEKQIEQVLAEPSSETSHTGQYFSDIVVHLIRSQYNVGTLEKPDAQGLFLGECGDRMQIDLMVINQRIMDAKFIADGCGATQACGSMITRMATTKTLEEAQRIQPDELIGALGGLPDDHLHCAELAVMTLREAVIDAIEGHRTRLK